MSASSVTGISGPGEARGMKGPGNLRNQYVPLVSPHVVEAGQVTLSGTTSTVTFPAPLAGGFASYMVFAQGFGAGTGAQPVEVTSHTNDSSGNFASFVLTATSAEVVNWMVVSIGSL